MPAILAKKLGMTQRFLDDGRVERVTVLEAGPCPVTAIRTFDADTRKNKRVARQMQEMVTYINAQQLSQMKELDEDRVSVTCVTCHMGSGHPKDTMSVPMPPIPTGRN